MSKLMGWYVKTGRGDNRLGELLMEVRGEISK